MTGRQVNYYYAIISKRSITITSLISILDWATISHALMQLYVPPLFRARVAKCAETFIFIQGAEIRPYAQKIWYNKVHKWNKHSNALT